jgi:hypothetical protein
MAGLLAGSWILVYSVCAAIALPRIVLPIVISIATGFAFRGGFVVISRAFRDWKASSCRSRHDLTGAAMEP